MSMYECRFCGEEYGDYPKVLLFINSFGDQTSENTLSKKFEEFSFKNGYYGNETIESQRKARDKVFVDFNEYVMNNMLWFCSNKCAQLYLTHELPEWELDKLGE